MNILTAAWSDLIELNKRADTLVERVRRAVDPTQPIGREIAFKGTIEALFDNLPQTYSETVPPNSDALAGNNVKMNYFTNKGARIYVRSIGFQSYYVLDVDPSSGADYEGRYVNAFTNFPFNFRWNFKTSMTGRWYSDRRCLARAGGNPRAGTKLVFREPLIIEPSETFTFECELIGGFNMQATAPIDSDKAVVSMLLSGYREGV